jgi:hypothetical protein
MADRRVAAGHSDGFARAPPRVASLEERWGGSARERPDRDAQEISGLELVEHLLVWEHLVTYSANQQRRDGRSQVVPALCRELADELVEWTASWARRQRAQLRVERQLEK